MSSSASRPTSSSSPLWHPDCANGGGASPPSEGLPRVLITAGPTYEPIDAVRFLGNRSSGQMGIAIAEAAARTGARTTLLLGPTHLKPQEDSPIQLERFRSTSQLGALLETHWPQNDLLFMAAAVADYRPVGANQQEKLRRGTQPRALELEPTPDLLAGLAQTSRADQLRIGWALEPSEELLTSARAKLERKKLDAIVANPLETIDSSQIQARLLLSDGGELEPPSTEMSKNAFALWLLETALELRKQSKSTS